MYVYESFMETFEIPKITIQVPGRDVDDDGNICSWYDEEVYPDIEPVFFDLLALLESYNITLKTKTINRIELEKAICNGYCDLYKKLIKESNFKEVEYLVGEVKDIFLEYYKPISPESTVNVHKLVDEIKQTIREEIAKINISISSAYMPPLKLNTKKFPNISEPICTKDIF